MNNAITDIPGIRVGQAQDPQALTGCTVILAENGAVCGVDQRGGAPGTRETDLLRPMHLVNAVHAVVLTGGSAFGLDCASGVMRYLEEQKIGFDTGFARVPIVPAAVLYDLGIGSPSRRPDADMGYQAALAASAQPPQQGNFGAGTGATVGKILGPANAMKSGIGTASMEIGGGIKVAAIIAVNAFGDILDPKTQHILAGARTTTIAGVRVGSGDIFADTEAVLRTFAGRAILSFTAGHNTVIGAVATNAKLTNEEANKVAQMAHNGLALTIRPAHTMLDGDTLFALATGKKKADVNLVGAFSVHVVAQAVVNAVLAAAPAGGLPSHSSLAI